MTTGRLLLAGLLGSALVCLGGWGSGALPPGQAGWGPGTPLALAGVLLLGAAWWWLRSGAVAAAVLWSLPLLVAPPLFSRDAYAYVGQGALVVEGLDPYSVGPGALPGPLADGVDEVWRDAPSPYGPLWLALAGAVVRLAGDRVLPGLTGVRLLAVLGLLLAGVALHRLGGERAVWLGVTNPLVLLHLVGGAHNEALALGPALAGLAVLRPGNARRLAPAAALITCGALIKLPVAVVLAFVVAAVPGGWPARLRAAAVVLPTAAATTLLVVLGSGLGWGWLSTLGTGTGRLSLLSVSTGVGLLLPGSQALEVAWAVGLALGAAVAAALLGRTPRLGAPLAAGLALLAVALLLPVVQPWYLLWGVLPLAAAAGPRLAGAVGALCLVVCLLVEPSGRHVVRPPLHGLPTVLAAAAAAVVWRGRAPDGAAAQGQQDRATVV